MAYDPMQAIDEILRKTNNLEGWSGLGTEARQASAAQRRAVALEQFEAARIIAAPFMTPAGRDALEEMRRRLVMQSKFQVDQYGLFNGIALGVFREGQASVVHWIDNLIAVVEQGPPGPDDGGES